MTQHLIVPSNPTPNGDLHIGHIAGPYIGADALRRAAITRGEDAAVLLGTAWQQTHVLLAARRQGRDVLAVASEFAAQIEESFAAADIGYDVMLRHEDMPSIEQMTRRAWSTLRELGMIVVRDSVAHYCSPCRAWRFQGLVAGRCPRCGSPDAYGIDCEQCGLYHDDAELLDAMCTVCDEPTELRPLRRAFLELEPQRAWFEQYLGSITLGDPVREYAESVLSEALPSVAVTVLGGPGIPALDEELPGQTIYPAFELAPRYVVMTARHRADSAYEPARTRTSMVFGVDNAFERVFLFPAVLRGLTETHAPFPDVMHLTYFYMLDGAKFSTSRRHIVGVAELVGVAGADAARLYLAANRPERSPTNFTRSAFEESAEVSAVRRLRAWADTGEVPPRDEDSSRDPCSELEHAASDMADALRPERLSCQNAARAVLTLTGLAGASHGDRFRDAVLNVLVNGAVLVPDTAARLASAFAVPRRRFDGAAQRTSGGRG